MIVYSPPEMLQSRDFRELLKLFEKHEVRYLVVGGYAVMLYSEPRWTKDLEGCRSHPAWSAEWPIQLTRRLQAFSPRKSTFSCRFSERISCRVSRVWRMLASRLRMAVKAPSTARETVELSKRFSVTWR